MIVGLKEFCSLSISYDMLYKKGMIKDSSKRFNLKRKENKKQTEIFTVYAS